MVKKLKSEYEKQRDFWYKKLAKTGFVDIELNETHFREKSYFNEEQNRYSTTWRNSKIEYYHMATMFLNDYKFESDLEQAIWDYHSNGISVDDIVKTLKKLKISKMKRTSVWLMINELRKKMYTKYGVR